VGDCWPAGGGEWLWDCTEFRRLRGEGGEAFEDAVVLAALRPERRGETPIAAVPELALGGRARCSGGSVLGWVRYARADAGDADGSTQQGGEGRSGRGALS
jgi:hypothetical protein